LPNQLKWWNINQALLSWLGNYGYISYEKQQELLRELGGIEIGIGTLQSTNTQVADAVKPALDSLMEMGTITSQCPC
jgi:transposase